VNYLKIQINRDVMSIGQKAALRLFFNVTILSPIFKRTNNTVKMFEDDQKYYFFKSAFKSLSL